MLFNNYLWHRSKKTVPSVETRVEKSIWEKEGTVFMEDETANPTFPASPSAYEPMRRVPFMSLAISLEETERSSDENEDEASARTDEQSFVSRGEISQNSRGSHGGLISWSSETYSKVVSREAMSYEKIPQDSCLLDILTFKKKLSASPAVVDLVARVSQGAPVNETQSDGSPIHSTRQLIQVHRTPIPTEIHCVVTDASTALGDDDIFDPTDPLIFGSIHNQPQLHDVARRMFEYLISIEDGNINSLCSEAISFIHYHPVSCQIKYKIPRFGYYCHPLHYFAAAGLLELSQACYAAFPEAIGQEQDSKIGLPLHYACLYQASYEVRMECSFLSVQCYYAFISQSPFPLIGRLSIFLYRRTQKRLGSQTLSTKPHCIKPVAQKM
jgi:hypothetical protein